MILGIGLICSGTGLVGRACARTSGSGRGSGGISTYRGMYELVSKNPARSRRITAASACCSVGRLAKVVASCRVQAGVLEIIPDTLLGPRRLRAVVAVREPRKGVGSVTGSVPEGHSSATKSEFPDPNSNN